MGIHNNSPTLSWISLDGITVKKDDLVYTVRDFKTNLKYIYWESDNPYILKSSNVLLDTSSIRYHILTNDKGTSIIIPNNDIEVSFDGNSIEAINSKIWGLYETDKEHGDKFVTVEQDINGIKNTVGEWNEENGSITEKISKIDQKSNEIELSVSKINKTYLEDQLRENVNKSIIDFNSALGLFYSKILDYFKDDSITSTERNEIQVQYSVINAKKTSLYEYVDKVIQRCQENEENTHVNNINSAKTSLESSWNNLQTNINSAISDNVISPSDRTLVINSFANCNLKVNDLKATIDSAIILGMGGSISEAIASLNMKSNEINLSVQESDKNTKAELSVMSDRISSKVDAGDVTSIIEQSPNAIKYGFNGISDYVVISPSGLTVNRGSIACSSITTPSGTDPIITLFGQCSLDATLNYETGGFGQYMRMKWDRYNYLAIGRGEAVFYQKFGDTVNNQALKIYMSDNTSTRLVGAGNELLLARHGLYFRGTPVSMNGHTHRAGDFIFDNTEGAYFGNITTGTSSSGSYMGGYIKTSGRVQAAEGFVERPYTSSMTFTGRLAAQSTSSVTPNVEYVGEDTVVNGECVVSVPDVILGMGVKYSIQLTPIGNNPHIYVYQKNSDSFIVRGDNCDFDYTLKVILPRKPKRLR